jgi:DNA invertase Pin-like site-specific DNA recombinase
LNKAGCEKIFTDHGISGIAIVRPGLSQAIAAVVQAMFSWYGSLDRFGRSLSFLIELIEKLRNDQAGFESLSDVSTPPQGAENWFFISWARWPGSNAR